MLMGIQVVDGNVLAGLMNCALRDGRKYGAFIASRLATLR